VLALDADDFSHNGVEVIPTCLTRLEPVSEGNELPGRPP
jgi:hypothetical protein